MLIVTREGGCCDEPLSAAHTFKSTLQKDTHLIFATSDCLGVSHELRTAGLESSDPAACAGCRSAAGYLVRFSHQAWRESRLFSFSVTSYNHRCCDLEQHSL